MLASGFSWFHLLPQDAFASLGIHEHAYLIYTAWAVCGFLVLFAAAARASLMRAWQRPGIEKYFSDDRLTLRSFAEVYGGAIYGLVKDILGEKDAPAFFPLVGALFLYIFTCNIIGIFPGLLPPTDNINNNVGMAVVVFLVFNFVGLTRDPKGYIGHMMGPVLALAPLLFIIEAIGLLIRPVSLSLRLTGNMFGDHTVFSIMSGLVPLVVPSIFLALAMFVSFVQAFVFSLLSTIYIGLSLPHHDHAEEHH